MTTLMFLLLTQYVVSTKAGLVNYVQGPVNVEAMHMVGPGVPIRTGPNGYAKILLTPGSFLRLDEQSEAVLENVELAHVAVRIVSGSAIIEVVDISKDYPIRVTTGNLTTQVFQAGVFRFADGLATVLEGKLRTVDNFAYERGWQIFYQNTYRARRTARLELTGLDVFSRTRSELIAYANQSAAPGIPDAKTYWQFDYWLYSPAFGAFTFMPRSGYRSPYGYRFYRAGQSVYVPGPGSSGGSVGSSGNVTNTNRSGESGGGGFSGGGTAVVSTPSGERSSPGTYIESKSAPAPATIP